MHTCSDHGYGGLDVDPLVCVDAGVDEDEAIKVGLLDSTQRILNGVVILQANGIRLVQTFNTFLR